MLWVDEYQSFILNYKFHDEREDTFLAHETHLLDAHWKKKKWMNENTFTEQHVRSDEPHSAENPHTTFDSHKT